MLKRLWRLLMNIFNFNCCEEGQKRIEELLKEQNRLSETQIRILRRIEHSQVVIAGILADILIQVTPRVTGGTLTQKGNEMALLPIAPGNSPQFGVTPEPAGVSTLAGNTSWTSSDTTNAPVTMNASDPTGLTATVDIPASAVVGTNFTLTWQYTNADGTVVLVPADFTIVSAGGQNVTGGTMAQIV